MKKNKRLLSVLSKTAVLGLILTAVSSPVLAKPSAIDINAKDGKVYEYQLQNLKDSAVAEILNGTSDSGAKLYNDFVQRKVSTKAYYDDVRKAYIDFDLISKTAIDAALSGGTKTFDFKTFMEDTTNATTTVTANKVVIDDNGNIAILTPAIPVVTPSSGSGGGYTPPADTTPPTVTATAQTVTNGVGQTVNVQSNEGTGKVYIIKDGETDVTAATAAYKAKVGNVVSANTNVALSTEGLLAGTYHAYAVDAAGNVSVVGTNAITITAAAVQAAGGATTTEGTHTITYTLTKGTFDATTGALNVNWTLAGTNAADLGSITGVALSNGNKTATITVSGTVGATTKNYTVVPVQAAMASGFTAPLAATVGITAAADQSAATFGISGRTNFTVGSAGGTAVISITNVKKNDGSAVNEGTTTLTGNVVVKVDGATVDASNYTIDDGLDTITLSQAYLNTLTEGTKQFTVEYTDAANNVSKQTSGNQTVTVAAAAAVQAAGGAATTEGTHTITYTLTTGTFDATAGASNANWTLAGTNAGDLGSITGVVLSNGNKTATITVSGTVGTATKNYTVVPAQAAMTSGFTAPTAAIVGITAAADQSAATFGISGRTNFTAGSAGGTAVISITNVKKNDGSAVDEGTTTLTGNVVVKVDGSTVDASNYTIDDGLDTITFSQAYLNTLTAGTKQFTVEYTDAANNVSKQTSGNQTVTVAAAAAVQAAGGAATTEGTHTITYTLTTGTFDATSGASNANWTLGGTNAADLGSITGVALSNGNQTATITVSGTVGVTTKNYTVAAVQAAMANGFTAPLAATVGITAAAVQAAGGATTTEGTHTITYTLTTGTFDTTSGASNANWTLAGTNAGDLGSITGVVLSNGNKTATITVSGTVGGTTENYTVVPVQAAIASGFTAPSAATVGITAASPVQAAGEATTTEGTHTITYTLATGTFDATSGASNANWTLAGTNAGDLGSITGVVLSNGNKTATITVSGTGGGTTENYTVVPVQAAMANGSTAPSVATVNVIALVPTKIYYSSFDVGNVNIKNISDLTNDGTWSNISDPGCLAVAVDDVNNMIYWRTLDSNSVNSIKRRSLSGGAVQTIITGIKNWNDGLAIDAVNGKIYWGVAYGNSSAENEIWSADLDGNNAKIYLSGNNVSPNIVDDGGGIFSTLDVAVYDGKVYWSTGYCPSGTTVLSGIIKRANLDGTGVETIHSGEELITSISIDSSTNKIYWANADNSGGKSCVNRSNLDGSSSQTYISNANSKLQGSDDAVMQVEAAGGKVVWTTYYKNLCIYDGSSIQSESIDDGDSMCNKHIILSTK
jgi:ribosomal protein S8E